MRVKNVHPKRVNRSAKVIAERDGIVLYDAYEGNDIIARNMVRPANKFWNDHAVVM